MLTTRAASTALLLTAALALVISALLTSCGQHSVSESGIKGFLFETGTFGGLVPSQQGQCVVFPPGADRALVTVEACGDGSFFVPLDPGRYEYVIWDGHGRPVRRPVEVSSGQVVDLGRSVLGGGHWEPSEALRAFGQRTARELALTGFVMAHVRGTSADGAHRLFGGMSPTGAAHVWVFVLEGPSSSAGPATDETRALASGGYVAYELDAESLEILAVKTSSMPWRMPPWVTDGVWGSTRGFVVKPSQN
jgi:hypothetical protein